MSDLVLHFSKYASQPPPDIVSRYEAGPNWERPANQGPIAIFRRAPTYDLKDYSGGVGVYMRDANANFPSKESTNYSFTDIYGTIKPTIMLNDIIKGNQSALLMWIHTYLLQNSQLSMYFAIRYLAQIANNDAEYPKDILNIVKSTIDRILEGQDIAAISQSAQQLQLYIPKNFYLPDLDDSRNFIISPIESFFFGNIYWLRYSRPEKSRLSPVIDKFSLLDLYLITANPFERYPGRKLLSYYNDQDLYLKFGRVGKFFFPKTYSSKRLQIDGIMGMCMQPFGYFTVQNWSRPVRIIYHYSEIPLGPENIQTFDLDNLINSNLSDLYMPLLRLGIQVESSWPLITDKETWIPFIKMINSNAQILHQEYLKFKSSPITNVSTDTLISLPDNFESLEQKYITCLLCEKVRPLGDFSLCGHGTCITCQSLLGTAKCPFCNEHFVADNINDEFVRVLQSDFGKNNRKDLLDKVRQINNLKQDRAFKFDWTNGDLILFS